MMNKRIYIIFIFLILVGYAVLAQQQSFTAVEASVNAETAAHSIDKDPATGWSVDSKQLKQSQYLMLALQTPGNVTGLRLEVDGLTQEELQKAMELFVTYDPMNLGEPIAYTIKDKAFNISFSPKYGAHLRILLKGGLISKPISIKEVSVDLVAAKNKKQLNTTDRPWMDATLSVDKRVELLLTVMTPEDKMELIREGWGIPGIPHLGIPAINKVEAIHGFSYGSGATIFPQSIGLGATWNKKLVEEVAGVIGDETVSANTIQAWSPVLDVAQDARWGRCEETYGEDPVLVSEIGGAWIKGFQAKGLFTTPKHFGIHGAPLGGRDSHDIGLSEREIREIHLVPFRHAIENYHCQSIMMAYSDFQGVPIAKSKELLQGILREEWGFDGFIVSDCGALGNLTSRKHYTAENIVDAANQALAAGIATNCGDTYNDKEVIAAAKDGRINRENLDNVCRSMLRMMFRNGLFEQNPSKPLDWDKVYPGWNSPEHRAMARKAAQEAIVLLENKKNILPLAKSTKTIAVIGPGADDLQPGDYTQKLQEGQLKSVLTGIKGAIDKQSTVLYEKGCEFFDTTNYALDKVRAVTSKADVVVMVLGDCSTSEGTQGVIKTSGENNDYATLVLPGNQQRLLEDVCKTGKPVVLILQAGRPYDLSYAAAHCQAILVNWLPGQEGGYATADVLFGDYNPAGRLPMTFPRHVGQLPLYYNFKTSGRRYDYVDMDFTPLYSFGYGLSYTKFDYSNLRVQENTDGSVTVNVNVKNIGNKTGDEVAQLYVTDMYASVKTRIMELKDFERIRLKPGDSKELVFTLTPYQLSLLNDAMDRVVEAGAFKIMVGGSSPSYVATDRIKNSVGFTDSSKGVNTVLDYTHSFAADFTITYEGMLTDTVDHQKRASVKVKNVGNLTDAGKLMLYTDGDLSGLHHFELKPAEEKVISFDLNHVNSIKNLTLSTKYKTITTDLGH